MTTLEAAPARPRRGARRNKTLALLLAVASIFILAACRLSGSGTIPSATGRGQATFTFTANCPSTGSVTGSMNYVDSRAGVSIHAVVGTGTNCSYGTIEGTYTPLKGGTGGTFTLCIAPGGTAYDYTGFFKISLTGGVYDGYYDSGWVTKGNIVVS